MFVGKIALNHCDLPKATVPVGDICVREVVTATRDAGQPITRGLTSASSPQRKLQKVLRRRQITVGCQHEIDPAPLGIARRCRRLCRTSGLPNRQKLTQVLGCLPDGARQAQFREVVGEYAIDIIQLRVSH